MDASGVVGPRGPVCLGKATTAGSLGMKGVVSSRVIKPIALHANLRTDLDRAPDVGVSSLFVSELGFGRCSCERVGTMTSLSRGGLDKAVALNSPGLQNVLRKKFTASSGARGTHCGVCTRVSSTSLRTLGVSEENRSGVHFAAGTSFAEAKQKGVLKGVSVNSVCFRGHSDLGCVNGVGLASSDGGSVCGVELESRFTSKAFAKSTPVARFVGSVESVAIQERVPSLFKARTSP